jgi:hypothetical protein
MMSSREPSSTRRNALIPPHRTTPQRPPALAAFAFLANSPTCCLLRVSERLIGGLQLMAGAPSFVCHRRTLRGRRKRSCSLGSFASRRFVVTSPVVILEKHAEQKNFPINRRHPEESRSVGEGRRRIPVFVSRRHANLSSRPKAAHKRRSGEICIFVAHQRLGTPSFVRHRRTLRGRRKRSCSLGSSPVVGLSSHLPSSFWRNMPSRKIFPINRRHPEESRSVGEGRRRFPVFVSRQHANLSSRPKAAHKRRRSGEICSFVAHHRPGAPSFVRHRRTLRGRRKRSCSLGSFASCRLVVTSPVVILEKHPEQKKFLFNGRHP